MQKLLKLLAVLAAATILLAVSTAAIATPGINISGDIARGAEDAVSDAAEGIRRFGEDMSGMAREGENDGKIEDGNADDGFVDDGNSDDSSDSSDATDSGATESNSPDSDDPLDRPADDVTSSPDSTGIAENDAADEAEGGIGVWGIIIAVLIVAAVLLLIFAFLPKR